MADAKKTEAPAEGEVPKKKSKLLIIILAAVLVLVLGGGGAAFFLMKKKADPEAEEGDDPPAKTAKAKKKKKDDHGTPPVFSKLEPFVVKLQAETQEAYVQAIPELKLLDVAGRRTGQTVHARDPPQCADDPCRQEGLRTRHAPGHAGSGQSDPRLDQCHALWRTAGSGT